MKITEVLTLTILTLSPAAMAADSTGRSSPLDKNAACMDRTVDASTGNCVVPDDGTTRRTYPPKPSPAAATPASSPAAPSSAVRKSAAGK